jgi:molecular chaperone DnaK
VSDGETVVGVDFGTSNTAAVLRGADGRIRPVLFDGAPLLPSAVFLEESGNLLVGRDALHAGRRHPQRLEPYPKQRIDDGIVLLGSGEIPVVDLVAAVLRRVADEAGRIAGRPLGRAVLTCPAGWGQRRRGTLRDAGERVFGRVEMVVEPVAAASFFVAVIGSQLPVDGCAMVYDLGAGTFDAAVVRRTAEGLVVLAAEGLSDAGGLDIDAAVVGYLGAIYAVRDPDRWRRLMQPQTDADRRLRRQLWDDVRAGKEVLSRAASTRVPVPLFDDEVLLGREQLDELAGPVLQRTVVATRGALRSAGIAATGVTGVYLVGGGSRIPLAATLLHRSLGLAPTAVEQPELAVAEGSLRVLAGGDAPATAAGGVTAAEPTSAWVPVTFATTEVPASAPPGGGRRLSARARFVVPALLLAAAVAASLTLVLGGGEDEPGAGDRIQLTSAPATPATPATSPSPSAGSVASVVGDDCLVGTWELVKLVHPDVNFYGNSVTVTGSGAIYHYRPDGTGLSELRNVTYAGRAAGNRYEEIHNGKQTWRYRAGGGQIIYTDTKAAGTNIVKVNGKVRVRRGLKAENVTERYACTVTGMSLSTDKYTAELIRRSP